MGFVFHNICHRAGKISIVSYSMVLLNNKLVYKPNVTPLTPLTIVPHNIFDEPQEIYPLVGQHTVANGKLPIYRFVIIVNHPS